MADWELWDDGQGAVMFSGTEKEVKGRYMDELAHGDTPERDLFIEAPDGTQYAYNRNMHPHRWDEI